MHRILKYIQRKTLEYFILLLASYDSSQSSGGSGMCSRNDESAFTWLKFHRSLVNRTTISFRIVRHIRFICASNKKDAFGGKFVLAPPAGNFVAVTHMISSGSDHVEISSIFFSHRSDISSKFISCYHITVFHGRDIK